MDIQTFQHILTAFADSPADMDLKKGTLLVQVRDEVIEASISQRQGDLIVTENDDSMPANRWIIQRVARLPLLADRILSHVPEESNFVAPDGFILDHIDDAPTDDPQYAADAAKTTLEVLDRRPGGAASVLYLTSDAGEGKTTVISHLARHQAKKYKDKQTDWLIVPVSLGGRTFMRFDDVIVGALMNRLRFNLLFYDAFLELVRLGVLVPALDGFEEMFVEGAAGDAMSALGNLMQALQSSGSVLIAARKAYFEFKNLRAQTRLFDSLGLQSVTFSRLTLKRWDKARFLQYAGKRKIPNGEQIYDEVAAQLSPEHPLLTRAVLVRRVLDIASEPNSRKTLLDRIKGDPSDYFRQFIGSIILREAQEKWIDKVGEPAQPLISESEHYELLSSIAFEMWSSGTEYLAEDVMAFVAEMYADSKGKNKTVTHQIVERVKQHALIVPNDGNKYGFDHPEFYHFFLGEAIGQILVKNDAVGARHAFREAVLPQLAAESAARYIVRAGKSILDVMGLVNQIFSGEARMSIAKENFCGILIRLIDFSGGRNVSVEFGSFPIDALRGRKFADVTFAECYFQHTSLEHSTLEKCKFDKCEFEGLDLCQTSTINNVELRDSRVHMVIPQSEELSVYAPAAITNALRQAGFLLPEEVVAPAAQQAEVEPEEAVVITERLIRAFMRSTGVNENTLNMRLGSQAPTFFREVLPVLRENGLVDETPFRGGGTQRRFRLGVRLETITDALERCGGSFERFIALASE